MEPILNHCIKPFCSWSKTVVQHKALADKLIQYTGCPLAESSSLLTVNPIAYTNDSIKRVKGLFSFYLAISFLLNY